jgi:hypothetical protein
MPPCVLATVQGTGSYVTPEPIDVEVLVRVGQSNNWGTNPGLPGVTGAILYWDYDATTPASVKSTFWHPLHGTGVHLAHGADRSIGQALLDAGGYVNRTCILNCSFGSSFYTDWQEGRPEYAAIKVGIQNALTSLFAQYPSNSRYRFRQIRDQGQSDMRVNSLPYQSGWGAGQASWSASLETDIVEPMIPEGVIYSWKPQIIVWSYSGISNAYFINDGVRLQQANSVDANHLVSGESWSYEPDGVHLLGYPDLNGYIQYGYDVGNRVVFCDSIDE